MNATRQKWILFLVVTALVAVAAGFLARLKNSHRLGKPGLAMVERPVYDTRDTIVGTNTVDLPYVVLNYTSEPLPVTLDELGWLPEDTTYGRRRYTGPDKFWIDISIVLMGSDRSSIHKPQICLDGQGWKIQRSEPITIPIDQPHRYPLPVMKLTSSKEFRDENDQRQQLSSIFVYWFVSENRMTALHGERMWWMAKDLITTGVLQRWAYVTYLAVCRPGEEEATFERVKEFVAASVPKFQLVTGPEVPAATASAR